MTKQEIIDKWSKDKRRKIADSDKMLFCRGCRKDYYNGRGGAKQCWNLSKARLKKREICMSLHHAKSTDVVTLNCFIPEYH